MSVWKEKFISPNKFSRPQLKLNGVRKLVLHWTANYGATAENHYSYFNNLKDRYASAHIFVDKKEAINIIPLNEVAYHANDGSYRGVSALKPNANYLSIGVELCVEKDGTFHKDTIAKAVKVFAELCKKYKLNENDIVRHYDITHKNCPAPWVTDSSKFTEFKKSVKAELSVKTIAPKKASIVYEAHVQGIGWQGKKKDGQTAGTTGQSKRLEALTVKLENTDIKLEMQGHVQQLGWSELRTDGEVIGTVGEGLRLEAVKIKAKGLNVQYRVHVEKDGWTAWKKNGEQAGTTGQGKRIEAIEIKLV